MITPYTAVGLTVEAKVLALARAHFLWRVPYLEGVQGVIDGVPRGPPGPPELAALVTNYIYISVPPFLKRQCDRTLPQSTV